MTYKEIIYDITTNEEIERPYTDEENKAVLAAQNEAVVLMEKKISKDAARQAVLDKLGLSTDEVAALLG